MGVIIRSGDERFSELEGAWGLSGEPAIVKFEELKYRRVLDNEIVKYIELDRGERDQADPTGKWSAYYGPTNIREEM